MKHEAAAGPLTPVRLLLAAACLVVASLCGMAGAAHAGSGDVPGIAATDGAAVAAMGAACPDVCLTGPVATCAAVGGLVSLGALVLLLGSRPSTLLALRPRPQRRAVPATWPGSAPPWTVRSSTLDLCVIRV